MNLRYLDQKPKVAAETLPASERKKEIAAAELLLAHLIRLTRGTPGELLQPYTTAFRTKMQRIENYPWTLHEDSPDQPYIELALDPGHVGVLWAQQSEANHKWLVQYYQALCKLERHTNENLSGALGRTDFSKPYPFKGLTPPPVPTQKTVRQADVFDSYRQSLHYTRVTWGEGQPVPAWWNQDLHEKLCPIKPKKSSK